MNIVDIKKDIFSKYIFERADGSVVTGSQILASAGKWFKDIDLVEKILMSKFLRGEIRNDVCYGCNPEVFEQKIQTYANYSTQEASKQINIQQPKMSQDVLLMYAQEYWWVGVLAAVGLGAWYYNK